MTKITNEIIPTDNIYQIFDSNEFSINMECGNNIEVFEPDTLISS